MSAPDEVQAMPLRSTLRHDLSALPPHIARRIYITLLLWTIRRLCHCLLAIPWTPPTQEIALAQFWRWRITRKRQWHMID